MWLSARFSGCPHAFERLCLGRFLLSLILERVIFCHQQTTFQYGSVLVPRPILLSTCDDQLSVFKNTSYDLNNLAALTDFELIFITYFFVCAVN